MQQLVVCRPTAANRLTIDSLEIVQVVMRRSGVWTKHQPHLSTDDGNLDYAPLSDNALRLINIQAGRGPDPLQCDIYTVEELDIRDPVLPPDLECSPKYYALSYV